jgi:hypothetical protein
VLHAIAVKTLEVMMSELQLTTEEEGGAARFAIIGFSADRDLNAVCQLKHIAAAQVNIFPLSRPWQMRVIL